MSDKYGKFPKSLDEFLEYVKEIEKQPHDYNSIAQALTDTTVAFFNYFASKHGMTGFQCGWAGLRVLGTIRGMEAPFMVLDSSKMLYPQYDLHDDVRKFLDEVKPELGKLAKSKLDEENSAAPRVLERWKELAKYAE